MTIFKISKLHVCVSDQVIVFFLLILDQQQQVTTPTSHLPQLMKLAQAVTTSTPTHVAVVGWPLFSDQGADSPLSEIENTESPAQSINIEVSPWLFFTILMIYFSDLYCYLFSIIEINYSLCNTIVIHGLTCAAGIERIEMYDCLERSLINRLSWLRFHNFEIYQPTR